MSVLDPSVMDHAIDIALKKFNGQKHKTLPYIARLNGIANNLRIHAKDWLGDLTLEQLMVCVYLKDCDLNSVQEFPPKILTVVRDLQSERESKEAQIIYLAEVLDELYDHEDYSLDQKRSFYSQYHTICNHPYDPSGLNKGYDVIMQPLRYHIAQILGGFQFDIQANENYKKMFPDGFEINEFPKLIRNSPYVSNYFQNDEPPKIDLALREDVNAARQSEFADTVSVESMSINQADFAAMVTGKTVSLPKKIASTFVPTWSYMEHHSTPRHADKREQWNDLSPEVKEGLDSDEVFTIMQQAECTDIMVAIKALRKHGNIVDAILDIAP